MTITGNTQIIAHVGYPTATFKSPMIYNPWFEKAGVDAVVVPLGVKADDFASFFPPLFRLTNICGALITMPHKVSVVSMLDEVSVAVKVAGSCNAVRSRADGKLTGDMFDGEGFVRGMLRRGREAKGARALVVGSGGVGCAIAASLAGAGVSRLGLYDVNVHASVALAGRLRTHYPALDVVTGSNDPDGYDIVVNATPMGMNEGDPMPMDTSRISSKAFVGEVVMKHEITGFLKAAQDRGCETQVGVDMLFEQIPVYLEFFGLPATSPQELRALSQISY